MNALYSFYAFIPVPFAAPTSVNISAVTTSTITVEWGAVDCIHHNGDITGYSVQYGVQDSGRMETINVSGNNVTEATLSGLTQSTVYTIQVAAVNGAGVGVYSNLVEQETSNLVVQETTSAPDTSNHTSEIDGRPTLIHVQITCMHLTCPSKLPCFSHMCIM